MRRSEILQKVIEKSIQGGWDVYGCYEPHFGNSPTWKVRAVYPSKPFLEITDSEKISIQRYEPEQFIFSHSFAKAFWGELDMTKELCQSCGEDNKHPFFRCMQGWRFHLAQLVLAEDRLEYLERFINDEYENHKI